MPDPPKLDVKMDTSVDREQLDREYRQKILEEYKNGKIY